jgi:GTP cyclohydrolase I
MTEDLADLICRELNPRGVGVIVEASHSCMTIRGVRKPGSMTITSALRGIVKTNPTTRAELMALVFGGQR